MFINPTNFRRPVEFGQSVSATLLANAAAFNSHGISVRLSVWPTHSVLHQLWQNESSQDHAVFSLHHWIVQSS